MNSSIYDNNDHYSTTEALICAEMTTVRLLQLIWSPALLSHESRMFMVTDNIIILDVIALWKPGATKVPRFTFKNILSL